MLSTRIKRVLTEVLIMKNELANYGYEDGFFSPLLDFFAPEEVHAKNFSRGLAMKTDIKSDEKNVIMEIELPGIKKENIDVSLKNGYLTVRASNNVEQNEEKDKKGHYLHRERFYGSASRSYYLGDVDEKSIAASFENGVLTLTFPKEREQVEDNHKIAIK